MAKNYSKKSRKSQTTAQESEDEEEYEVAGVVDHKREKKGGLQYYVSWVGYPGELTWIDEESASGASDLVSKYWSKLGVSAQHERFEAGTKEHKEALAAKKKKAALSSKDSSSSKGTPKTKRGADAVDGAEESSSKSRRKSGASTASASATKANGKKATPAKKESSAKKQPKKEPVAKKVKQEKSVAMDEDDEEEEEGVYEDDDGQGHVLSRRDKDYAQDPVWEEYVLKVDTIEQDGNKGLRLLVVWKEDNTATWVPTEVARNRCPQKVIDFYENHLRFRNKGEEVDDVA